MAFCLTVSVPESREVLHFRNKREVHLGCMGVVVPWPWVVAVWPRGGSTEEAPKRLVDAGWGSERRSRRGSRRLGSYPLVSLGQILSKDLDLALH